MTSWAWRRIGFGAGIGVAAILAIGICLYLYANTQSGFRTIAGLVQSLSGGDVRITQLSGSFPNRLRADRIEVHDEAGAWLIAEQVEIDWSALAAIGNHIDVQRLHAQHIAVLRLPVAKPDQAPSSSSALRIDAAELDIPRLDIAADVAGHPLAFSAKGRAHFVSLQDGSADLELAQQNGKGLYRVNAGIAEGVIRGTASIDEPSGGLIAGLLGLSDIGALKGTVQASEEQRLNRIAITLDAGPMHAAGNGAVALDSKTAEIDFSLQAPAMMLRPDLSWASLQASGQMHGTFAKPTLDAKLDIKDLRLGGASIAVLSGDLRGRDGQADVTATATALRLGDKEGDIFARDPVAVTAHADLNADPLPIAFTVAHPLLSAEGNTTLGAEKRVTVAITLPRLAPFATFSGEDIQGRGVFQAEVAQSDGGYRLAVTGTVDAVSGTSMAVKLMGAHATLAIDTDVRGTDMTIRQVRVNGTGIDAELKGSAHANDLELDLTLALPDLSRLAMGLQGDARITASARGPMQTANVAANLTGNIATEGFSRQRVTMTVNATGLPKPAKGIYGASGMFNDSPVALQGAFGWNGQGLNVSATRADWKSLHAKADVTIPDKAPLGGQATLALGDLRDIAPLIGMALEGSLEGAIDFQSRDGRAHVNAKGMGLALDDTRLASLTVTGDILDPTSQPKLALDTAASGLALSGFTGEATARLTGPVKTLGIALNAKLADADKNPLALTSNLSLDTEAGLARIASLNAKYRDETATLRAPATIHYSGGVAIENLSATVGDGQLTASGKVMPALDLRASLQNVSARMLRPFAPLAQGTVSATAQLIGNISAPSGSVSIQGRGLRLTRAPASVAAATIDAKADLNGHDMTVSASLSAGMATQMTMNGRAPLANTGPLDLHAEGKADLAMFNAVLSAEGRSIGGLVAVNADIGGTIANPKVTGTAGLSKGDVQDHPRGLRIHDIALNGRFDGTALRIVDLSGQAGTGKIEGRGTIDLSAKGMPVDLTFTARNARPIASDRLRAALDADLTVKGRAQEKLTLAGTIAMKNGETILPDGFPPQVAKLNVRRSGTAAPPEDAPQKQTEMALDLTIQSPGQFFVRGHGLEAEMQGDIRISGTTESPIVSGGLTMRRGTLELAGQSLNFTTGKVSFDGEGLRNQIDPTLDFTAETSSGGVTARLSVTGYASAIKIQLSSTPPLPQDEILARLLFQQSVKQLTPLQLAEIAQAAASLSGLGSGFNPVASVRRGLGLDRLSVSSTSAADGTNSQTTIEAGKYIAPNVYVGAKQGLQNSTQAEVQIDLTKQLKAKVTINAGTNATVTQGAQQQDLGNSFGLGYQFEY